MKQSLFNLAMDLSNNMFAYHLCGVMQSMHRNNHHCPDPEKEALDYLKLYHADELAAEEARENNETPNHLLS